MAELIETPIMLVVTMVAAKWIVHRLAVPSIRLGVGIVALVLMLVAEFGLVLRLRGLSVREYLTSRNPGTVDYATPGSVCHPLAGVDGGLISMLAVQVG